MEETIEVSSTAEFKGVNYESPSSPVGQETFHSVVDINANAVSIIPFGFISNAGSTVSYNSTNQWWGEKDEGVILLTKYAQSQNLKVMIKPQVWIWGGDYTGDYEPNSEAEWINLENSYYNYILHYADIADSLNCELFCIGTEWKKFHQMRPTFWSDLIDSTRSHFSGELTYAGNWDSYNTFIHWSKLDYIGIDAYFPVSNKKTPSIEDCIKGWQKHKPVIKEVSKTNGKPVLFAEFGYRSVDYTGRQPWSYDRSMNSVNLQAQVNATQALFDVFWDEDWFAGGFVWKWFVEDDKVGGKDNHMFTPQNKPVEAVFKNYYKLN